jgi:hypothetical protein
MKYQLPFVVAILSVSLFSAVAVSQRYGRAGSAHGHGSPKSARTSHKQTFPRPNWELRYTSGSFKLKEGQWLKGAFVPEEIAHETAPTSTISVDHVRDKHPRTAPILRVELDQLRAIYFDPKAEKDSDLVQRMPRSGCGYAKVRMPKDDSAPRPEVFLAWVSSPGRASRAVEHLNARRRVRVVWNDGGSAEKELVLTVNQCEYASFIANLRRFAGQRWQVVGHESK